LYHTYLYTFHKAEAVWTRAIPALLVGLTIAFKSSVAQNNGLQKYIAPKHKTTITFKNAFFLQRSAQMG